MHLTYNKCVETKHHYCYNPNTGLSSPPSLGPLFKVTHSHAKHRDPPCYWCSGHTTMPTAPQPSPTPYGSWYQESNSGSCSWQAGTVLLSDSLASPYVIPSSASVPLFYAPVICFWVFCNECFYIWPYRGHMTSTGHLYGATEQFITTVTPSFPLPPLTSPGTTMRLHSIYLGLLNL